MPDQLVKRLEEGAAKYGLPVRTFMKLIVEMGLYMEEREGMYVIGSEDDLRMAVEHNREVLRKAKKRHERRTTGEPEEKEEVEPQQADTELHGFARLTAVATVRKPAPVIDDPILADAGVSQLPPDLYVAKPEPEVKIAELEEEDGEDDGEDEEDDDLEDVLDALNLP